MEKSRRSRPSHPGDGVGAWAGALLCALLMPGTVRADGMVCLPTCDPADARFFALAGPGHNTLQGGRLELTLAVPGSAAWLDFAVFDGDTSGRWDAGTTPLEYRLYADPLADGSGSEPIWAAGGETMPDGDWIEVRLPNVESARSPSGAFFYRLEVRPAAPSEPFRSNFKVRSGNLALRPQHFAFEAAMLAEEDFATVYPLGFPGPTTYSGTWTYALEVPPGGGFLETWDGDLDHGRADCLFVDGDDPDTPNQILPPFAGPGAVPEGAAAGDPSAHPGCASGRTSGSPPDDFTHAVFVRAPSVAYELIDPLGTVYANPEPSGNLEWERFLIDSRPGCDDDPSDGGADADHCVGRPPAAGLWSVRMVGVDLSNLNAWRFAHPVLGVDAAGRPAPRLRPRASTASPGFWKNHPERWPAEVLRLGDRLYRRPAVRALLAARGKDKSLTLARQLAAARFNLLSGNDASCIAAELAAADRWLTLHPAGSGVSGREAAWRRGEPLADRLADYNHGRLCAPGRR